MSDKIKESLALEEAASKLVLRELSDMEASDIYGGQSKPKWPKVTVGPVQPAVSQM